MENLPVKGGFNNLSLLAAEFYIAQTKGSEGIVDFFKDSDDSSGRSDLLNRKR